MGTNKKLLAIVLTLGISWSNANAGPGPDAKWQTLSGRGVILVGAKSAHVSLDVPACAKKKEQFLVLGVHVGPEVIIGATSIDVANLPRWAASVPVYQQYSTVAQIQVALNVLGNGAEHVSATLPGGQGVGTLNPLLVQITLLGGAAASHRFEFNVHVTGACGTASIMH